MGQIMTTNWKCQVTETPSNDHGLEMPNNWNMYYLIKIPKHAQILSTVLLKQGSCNNNVSAIHVHIKKRDSAMFVCVAHDRNRSKYKCTSLYRLVRDCYSTFLLLGVSSPWLLLAVSLTRHFLLLAITLRFLYSTYPMKSITCIFTQTFHYPTFQLLDVSALPLIAPKRLKVRTSNLAGVFPGIVPKWPWQIFPKSGRGHGHVTLEILGL